MAALSDTSLSNQDEHDIYVCRPKVYPKLLQYDCATLLPHVGGLTHDSMKVIAPRPLFNFTLADN